MTYRKRPKWKVWRMLPGKTDYWPQKPEIMPKLPRIRRADRGRQHLFHTFPAPNAHTKRAIARPKAEPKDLGFDHPGMIPDYNPSMEPSELAGFGPETELQPGPNSAGITTPPARRQDDRQPAAPRARIR